jgi:hypothetical protein
MLPHQLPVCTHVAHKDNPNTRQTHVYVSDNVNVDHIEREKPDENRGRDKEDVSRHEEGGWQATDKASHSSRDVRSRHIKSSHVTNRRWPRKRCVKKAKDKLQSTTEYQQQRINKRVSTTAYQQGY